MTTLMLIRAHVPLQFPLLLLTLWPFLLLLTVTALTMLPLPTLCLLSLNIVLALHHWTHIPSYRPQPLFKLLIKDVIIVEGG